MKNILSIHDGHNAAATIISDGKILSCIAEERLNRKKFYWGWPTQSIDYVLKTTGITLDQIDAVTVSHRDTVDYIKRKFSAKENYVLNPKQILGHLYHVLITLKREMKIRNLMRGHGKKEFFFCDHHLAHASSAYYYSGYENALVVSMDAQGDGLSHTAYEVKNGDWKLLVNGGSNESLGAFYAALTEGLGFTPNRHEGKIVGLAALADGKKLEAIDNGFFITISDDSLHFTRKPYQLMIDKVKELLAQGYTREEISAYGQYLLEKLVIKHINKLCEMTGAENLAVAGGVFANVKLNQKITEQCPIKKIFIQPAMGDEGLVLGSAAYFLDKKHGLNINQPMNNVYFGNKYSNDEVEEALKSKGYQYEVVDDCAQKVAQLLQDEKIVGWFDGQMEFGPRALGSRSIIVNPKRKEINDELNKRLNRSEFMPFAPSMLYEKADEIFENVEPGRHAAEFMTITFNVKSEWRSRIDAVVHVDGTARPQLVRKEINSNYYDVINEFYKLTGVPVVVNTSFNMHEEPIVCSLEDALRSFDVGAVDYLVFNNRFIIKK